MTILEVDSIVVGLTPIPAMSGFGMNSLCWQTRRPPHEALENAPIAAVASRNLRRGSQVTVPVQRIWCFYFQCRLDVRSHGGDSHAVILTEAPPTIDEAAKTTAFAPLRAGERHAGLHLLAGTRRGCARNREV